METVKFKTSGLLGINGLVKDIFFTFNLLCLLK